MLALHTDLGEKVTTLDGCQIIFNFRTETIRFASKEGMLLSASSLLTSKFSFMGLDEQSAFGFASVLAGLLGLGYGLLHENDEVAIYEFKSND